MRESTAIKLIRHIISQTNLNSLLNNQLLDCHWQEWNEQQRIKHNYPEKDLKFTMLKTTRNAYIFHRVSLRFEILLWHRIIQSCGHIQVLYILVQPTFYSYFHSSYFWRSEPYMAASHIIKPWELSSCDKDIWHRNACCWWCGGYIWVQVDCFTASPQVLIFQHKVWLATLLCLYTVL